MTNTFADVARASGRLGGAIKHHPELVADAERDLAAARIAKTIQERLAVAPPLRPEQIDRLTVLLGGGAATD